MRHPANGLNEAADSKNSGRVAALFDDVRHTFASVPVVSVAECRERLAAQTMVLVDTRGQQERDISIIPGAISREDFEADPAQHGGKTVVCYCTVGYRAGLYAKKLAARGGDVRLLEGAILGWVHEGGQLTSADGPTKRLHIFMEKFDLLPDGYEGVR